MMRSFRHGILLLITSLLIASSANAQQMKPDTIRDAYRHFIMPSAKPVEGGYFGFWELAFLQGGFGIGDVVSLSGGFTVMPTVAFRSQFGFLQGKLTLIDEEGFSFATGLNFLRLTSDYPYLHLFGVATIETPSDMRFSGMLFYKLSGNDFPTPNVFPYGTFQFSYGGALGAGLGFDMPLPHNPNMRVVAEAWNHDLTSPNKLAVLGALRVESEAFSSDFGFIYFTLPIIAPVANFVWRF